MKVTRPNVHMLSCTQQSARLIEMAGRTAYKSEDKITDDSADKFVEMIRKRGHESVIEHSYATFRIVTDRGITHEIVRHRLASYTQESTRYCNYSKDKFGEEITVIAPYGVVQSNPSSGYAVWKQACEEAETRYFELIREGCAPQIARSVLPTCLKTEIVMTANFREWLHFLRLRTAPAAHPDMVVIAKDIGAILAHECPAVFGKYGL